LKKAKEGDEHGSGKLPFGEFEAMVRDDLRLDPATARRLMIIAGNPVIANRAHAHALPPSWFTLYELTKVEPKVLQAAIKDGRVNVHAVSPF
jgi:hypothetical protein